MDRTLSDSVGTKSQMFKGFRSAMQLLGVMVALAALPFDVPFAVIGPAGAAGERSNPESQPKSEGRAAHTVPVTSEPITLHFERHDLDRIGKLVYMGGLEIKSTDKRFGGLSGLKISPDGRSLLAVTDRGHWVGATLDYQNGRLTAVRSLLIAPLLGPDGQDLLKLTKADADAEAITEIPGSGLVVSFEGKHRLWHYGASQADAITGAISTKRPLALPLPMDVVDAMNALPSNNGIEALTTLQGNVLFAIAEGGFASDGRTLKGWLIGPGGIRTLAYRTEDDFRPTDMATLPNGDVLVLERRFNLLQGLSTRLRRIDTKTLANALEGDDPIEGELLATLAFPYNIDNMEGLAVRRDDAGRTLVYLVSDDNFNPLQRTLLMVFRLDDDAPVAPPVTPETEPAVIIAAGN